MRRYRSRWGWITKLAYDALCAILLAQGVAKKQLPMKPKKGIKPKEVEMSKSEPEIEGSDEDKDEDE